MAVPLVGSPAPPPSYAHLITGNDSEFTSTVGAWVNTGGTQTRDTTVKYFGQTASLKLVTSAAGHRTDLSLPGTFKLGAEYALFMAINLEETGITAASLRLRFGLVGTDAADMSASLTPNNSRYAFNGGTSQWGVVGMRWKPTANRTGVSVRFERLNADGSNTQTWHIGWVKAFRLPVVDGPATLVEPNVANGSIFAAPNFIGASSYLLNAYRSGGLYVGVNGDAGLEAGSGKGGLQIGTNSAYLWTEHTASDLSDDGFNLEVGTDYLGVYVSEKDSNTVQFYADVAAGFMMQLRNRGSGKGWAVSDDGTVNQKITDTFQWSFYVAGVQATGTDKAPYFQVPEKCKIDEVRIHLGTAPTGANFIVDVNDDGTTIFTTQANRPEITAGANDDTSGAADGGTAVAKDSVLTIDIDQIGSGTAGSDLVVFVRGRTIW